VDVTDERVVQLLLNDDEPEDGLKTGQPRDWCDQSN